MEKTCFEFGPLLLKTLHLLSLLLIESFKLPVVVGAVGVFPVLYKTTTTIVPKRFVFEFRVGRNHPIAVATSASGCFDVVVGRAVPHGESDIGQTMLLNGESFAHIDDPILAIDEFHLPYTSEVNVVGVFSTCLF